MNVTGRPAQFGRGVMVEVGGKLAEKFAENLAKQITGDNGTADAAASGTEGTSTGSATASEGAQAADDAGAAGGGPATAAPEAGAATGVTASADTVPASTMRHSEDSLNLVRLVGPAILKRVIPVAAAVAGIVLLGRRLRHLVRRGAHREGQA
jgi:hypothetical protein